MKAKDVHPPKTNMDTQNDVLKKVPPLQIWPCLVSMLNFWGVSRQIAIIIHQPGKA